MFHQYSGVAKIFREYWLAYGGLRALLGSPYLHAAGLLLLLTQSLWLHAPWWRQSFFVLPSLLGFTLGGFAIFLGFGDAKFRAVLAEQEPEEAVNAYVGLCATFVHFILVQAIALIAAILAAAWWSEVAVTNGGAGGVTRGIHGMIGYGLFLYAIILTIAAAMHVFRIARIYATFVNADKNDTDECARCRESTARRGAP